MNLPNNAIHAIYKEYVDTMNSEEKKKEYEAAQAVEEMQDLGG